MLSYEGWCEGKMQRDVIVGWFSRWGVDHSTPRPMAGVRIPRSPLPEELRRIVAQNYRPVNASTSLQSILGTSTPCYMLRRTRTIWKSNHWPAVMMTGSMAHLFKPCFTCQYCYITVPSISNEIVKGAGRSRILSRARNIQLLRTRSLRLSKFHQDF